jgi:hypothetical protein
MSRSDRPSGFERTSLTAYAPQLREADPALGRAAGARAWHELELLVVNPAHVRDLGTALRVQKLAEELYGKRKGKTE